MAYYIVDYEDKVYANKELYMAMYRLSSEELYHHDCIKLLGVTLFGPVNEKVVHDCTFNFIRNDVSVQLNHIKTPIEAGQMDVEVIPFHEVSTPLSTLEPYVYQLNGFFLVPVRLLGLPNKYRLVKRLPTIQVAGRNLLVALNAVNTTVDNPLVLEL